MSIVVNELGSETGVNINLDRRFIVDFLPKCVVKGVHFPSVQGDVLLRVVGRGRAGGEALGEVRFLDVRRIVLRQGALFPDAGVAWKRTLRSIDYVYNSEFWTSGKDREHLQI